MLRAIIDLVMGGLILWYGIFGLRSGFKYGVFPGLLVRTRASPQEKPVTFWANVVERVVLVIAASLYLLIVLWTILRGTKAP